MWGRWRWTWVVLAAGTVGCATTREAPPELVDARDAVESLDVEADSVAANDADAARRHLRSAECGLVLDRDPAEIEQYARRAQRFAERAERTGEREHFGMGMRDGGDQAIGDSGQAGQQAFGGSGVEEGVTCDCRCGPGQEGTGGSGEVPVPGTIPEPNVPVQPGDEGVGGSGPPEPPTPLENDPYPLDYEEQLHGPPPGIPAQDLPTPPDENGFAPDTGPID